MVLTDMPIEKFIMPESLEGALDALNEYGSDALILAGGTMVMPLVNEAQTSPRVVVSLQRAGLSQVNVSGLLQTALKPNELVTRIIVPKPRGKTNFVKFARREANAPAIVSVAARLVTDPEGVITEARVALGAANDFPMRAKKAEALLVGRGLDANTIADVAQAAMNEAKPFSDAIASEWYRKKMVGVFVRRVLEGIE